MKNCSTLASNCPCPKIDPDLAGIGVVVAFLFTTTITALLCLIGVSLLGTSNSRSFIDRSIHKILRVYLKFILDEDPAKPKDEHGSKRRAILVQVSVSAIRNILLSLYDQSLFLGMAFLVIQFVGLGTSQISAIDYILVQDLVWMCSLTHLFCIDFLSPALTGTKSVMEWSFDRQDQNTTGSDNSATDEPAQTNIETTQEKLSLRLRKYLQKLDVMATNVIKMNSVPEMHAKSSLAALRNVRAYALLLMFLMFASSLSLGPSREWYGKDSGCLATCLLHSNPSAGVESNYQSVIFLGIAYLSNLLRFWTGSNRLYVKLWLLVSQLKDQLLLKTKSTTSRSGKFINSRFLSVIWRLWVVLMGLSLIVAGALTGNVALLAIAMLTSSVYMDLISFMGSYIIQAANLVTTRSMIYSNKRCLNNQSDNQWTTGQILPVVLLVLPLLTLLQTYSEARVEFEIQMESPAAQEGSETPENNAVDATETADDSALNADLSQTDENSIALQPITNSYGEAQTSELEQQHNEPSTTSESEEHIHAENQSENQQDHGSSSAVAARNQPQDSVQSLQAKADGTPSRWFVLGRRTSTWHYNP